MSRRRVGQPRSDLSLLAADLVTLMLHVGTLAPCLDQLAGSSSVNFEWKFFKRREHDAGFILVDDVDDAVHFALRNEFESLEGGSQSDFRHTPPNSRSCAFAPSQPT